MTSRSSPPIHRHWPPLGPCSMDWEARRADVGYPQGGRAATLIQVAEQFGLSTQRISQIEFAAMKKLRAMLEAQGIRSSADLMGERDEAPEEYSMGVDHG